VPLGEGEIPVREIPNCWLPLVTGDISPVEWKKALAEIEEPISHCAST